MGVSMQRIPGLAALERAVELRRGKSVTEILAAVRVNCRFGAEVSDEQLFRRTCIGYYGHATAESLAPAAYEGFARHGQDSEYRLPEFVIRYGDDDENVNYRI